MGIVFDRGLKPIYVRLRGIYGELLFERRYGLETSDLAIARGTGAQGETGQPFRSAAWTGLRRILPPGEIRPEDVFLDIGAGSGRVVFLAARYPFKRVIGIEMDDRLTAIARGNIDRNRNRLRCTEIELVTVDATRWEVPSDVTVAYLNNPFKGEVFRTAVAQLLASYDRQPRRMRLVYFNPIEHDYLMSTGRFEPIRMLRGWRPGREWSRSNSGRLYEVRSLARAYAASSARSE